MEIAFGKQLLFDLRIYLKVEKYENGICDIANKSVIEMNVHEWGNCTCGACAVPVAGKNQKLQNIKTAEHAK